MTYFYAKNGEVKMRSESPIVADGFDVYEIEPTDEQKDLLAKNAKQYIKNGALTFGEVPNLPTDTTEEREALKQKLRDKAAHATSIADLKDIINQLLA